MARVREAGPAAKTLKSLRDRAGLSVRAMADKLGLPFSTYASWETEFKKAVFPLDRVRQIAPHLVGRGEPPITEAEVLALAGLVPPEALTERKPRRPNGGGADRVVTIPEYDVRPQAGGGAAMPPLDGDGNHLVVGTWSMPAAYLRAFAADPGAIRIIQVAGDSMEPDYMAGERVAVDTSHRIPSPPGVYVLWDGFGLVLKRVEIVPGSGPKRVRLMSINPAYPSYEVPLADVHINGRVIGKWVWR
jgi:phage repressor protein C with HTH and peptisase S24 domain/DNA-binding XRE family transcriptional regulator